MNIEETIATYDRVAADFAQQRSRKLFEKASLDRMLGVTPRNLVKRRLLDLGCGTGAPIATYLSERGMTVTGVDGSAAMIALFATSLPHARAVQADMRTLALGEPFDAILAWNSLFHLPPAAQRAMFAVFRSHAAPNAALMFTTGTTAGEQWGHAAGAPVYHASLDAQDYRDLMETNHFKVLSHRPEDPDCDGHTIWLARFTG